MWAAKHPRVQEPSPDVTLQQHAGKEETNDTCQRRWPHRRVSDVLPTVNDTSRVQIIKRVQNTNANVGQIFSEHWHSWKPSAFSLSRGIIPPPAAPEQPLAANPTRRSPDRRRPRALGDNQAQPLSSQMRKIKTQKEKQACPKSAASNGKSRNGITESIKLNLPANYLP